MKRITTFVALLSIVALALFAAPMLGQNQQYPFPGYPAEFAPSRTSRPRPPAPPLVPSAKFTKLENAVPNQYIVVLNDDSVSRAGNAPERRGRVADLARRLIPAGAEIRSVYGTVLRGFCVKLPNEAAAIALSKDPRVKYVESDGLDGSSTDTQSSAPAGLDRIDQMDLPLDTNYTYNRTGSGVTVYDVGPGVRTTHNEFGSRAFIAADIVASHSITDNCTVTSTNNDCDGHGTRMLGVVGGTTYGVAKGASLGSVKVSYLNSSNQAVFVHSIIVEGIEWITDHHNDNPTQLEVANCSFMTGTDTLINGAVTDSIASGVTYAIAAGNRNVSLDTPDDPPNFIGVTPAQVGHAALVAGAEDQTNDNRVVFSAPNDVFNSDYGSRLALWAPGKNYSSATSTGDDYTIGTGTGTSGASAHTAGAAALYLQGRTGMNECGSHPITGPSSSTTGGAIATCPDRVNQFIMANSTLNRLATSGSGAIGTLSPNRLLFIGAIPTTTNFNPIDNQRFYVWQHYGDFLENQPEPDEDGLDWWTSEITGHGHCTAGVNDNDSCTNTWRINTSRAFWVYQYGTWFASSYGLATNTQTSDTANTRFLKECYKVYLRRNADADGLAHWVDDTTVNYGEPANAYGVLHLIDAFINSPEYRQRFGGS